MTALSFDHPHDAVAFRLRVASFHLDRLATVVMDYADPIPELGIRTPRTLAYAATNASAALHALAAEQTRQSRLLTSKWFDQ